MSPSLTCLILSCHWQLLIDNLADNCYKVAVDRSGCCVLQICVEKSKGQPRQRLVSEILANAVHLSRDPYGFVLSTRDEFFSTLYLIFYTDMFNMYLCI